MCTLDRTIYKIVFIFRVGGGGKFVSMITFHQLLNRNFLECWKGFYVFIKIVIFYLFGFPLMNFSVMFANFCFGSKSFFANFTETSFLFMPIQMSKIKFSYVSSPSVIHMSRIYKFYDNVYTYSSMSKKSFLDLHPYSMYVDYKKY